jgi:hypothetical protein
MAQMMIRWTIMVFTVARMMMKMAILPTTHQTSRMKMMRMEMKSWATAWMAHHQQCLHVAKMVKVSLGDNWMTCQIGCMKLKQITQTIHPYFLLPPSPRFFHASHARISTTPQHGFPFFCRRQAIPHGRCLTRLN